MSEWDRKSSALIQEHFFFVLSAKTTKTPASVAFPILHYRNPKSNNALVYVQAMVTQ